ncbi:alpha-protein kinase 2 isoform X1 [Arvicanthis niloticus]|uniref:alpha-protein kinase 2 isoform X1 n=1 Tax=Arvicanthis niloticus TaxID=61156 RepID=UPI001485EBE0|nr:alpha-protein kinase 2 [Arvicanthis niloticus]
MTDPGCPQRHTLCFLSTLLSQKVPEKSDVVLRCMIAGQPKPEVTWYKNGQAIDSGGTVSSYEFFENQYIHLLHLSCCTQSDTAVYQVSARSCVGMICCSASLEVQCLRDPQVSPDLGHDRDVAGKRETEIRGEDSINHTEEKLNLCKKEESVAPGACMSADSFPDKFNHLNSPQIVASGDSGASNSENPQDVKEIRRRPEPFNSDNMQENSFNLNNTIEKQDVSQFRTVHATVPELIDDGLGYEVSNESITPSHQTPKAQKYISFSLPLQEATLCSYPGDSNSINMQPEPQISSEDSDSDYELCPEITLTYTEEFSDDDLEYLECSDVMTDYSNAVWQRSLQGTDRVFLLESDDEEMEFNEYGQGGCEHFFSEMGCGPQVSGGMWPMNVATGFCSYHSQPQEVGVRSSGTSRHSPLPLHSEMTLTLGPHQDGTAKMTEPGRAPLPTAPEAVENDCSGIRGETRDNPEAGEEFSRDYLQTMDKAETEASVKPLSGGSDKAEVKQGLESLAGEHSDAKYPGSRKAALRPTRARRPGMKANAKKQLLKDSAPKGTLDPLPKEPTRQPLAGSSGLESTHTEAGAGPGWDSHFHEEVCIQLPAEEDSKTPRPPADPLSKEEDSSFQGGEALFDKFFEASQIPDQTDHLQMQIQETIGESSDVDQMLAFSVSAEEESTFNRPTTHFVSNLSDINRENSSLAQYLGLESCPQSPQQEARSNREGDMPGALWTEESAHELSPLEDDEEEVPQAPASVALPQGDGIHFREPEALSDAFSRPTAPSLPLENVGSGSRGREAACVMGCFEAGDQETCYATMDLLVGAPVDKYFPQEICPEDLELTEGQSEVCDLCSPDKILAVLQTQGSESSLSTHKLSKDGKSADSPLFNSTFTWTTSQEASEDAMGETPADVGNSIIFSSALPYNERGFGETQPLCSENISCVKDNEGGCGSSNLSVPIDIDTLASYSSARECSEEQSTESTANVDCYLVTRETEGILTDTTEVHEIKCHTVSFPQDNDFDGGADQVSCEAQDEDSQSLPNDAQSGRTLSSSTGEATGETLVPASSNAEAHGYFSLPEGQGLCSRSLQIDNQPGCKSQTVEGAHSRGLEEDFQEKGSGMKQCIRPQSTSHRGSLSANDFQEILPSIPATQQEANVEPLEHSLAGSGEEIECSSDQRTSVSVLAEKTVGEDSHLVSSVPSLPDTLLGEKDDVGLASWAVGSKVKIITLEAPVFEIWPQELVTHSGYKEAEVGLTVPGRSWALSDILRAGATRPEPGPLEVAAWVPSSQADALMALGANRDTCVGTAPDRQAYYNSLSSQCLGQPRLLESSVDPVEEKELDVTDSLLEISKTGETELAETVNGGQEEAQQKLCHPVFVNQSVNFPRILESSVDPIDDRGETEGVWSEKPEPSDSNIEGNGPTVGDTCQRVDIQPAKLQVPHPQDSGGIIPNKNTTHQNHVDREGADAKASQPNGAKAEAKAAIWQAQGPGEERQRFPNICDMNQTQDGGDRSLGEAGHRGKDETEVISPMSPLSSCLTGMTHTSVKADTNNSTGHNYGGPEPRTHHSVIPMRKEKGTIKNKCGKHVPSSNDLTDAPCTSPPKGNVTCLSISHDMEELKLEELQVAETKPLNSSDSPTMTLALISGECESEKDPEGLLLRDPCQKGSTLDSGEKSREERQRPVVDQISRAPGAQSSIAGSEEGKKKQEASGSGHLAAGIKKKILSRVAALRLKLEEKENMRKNSVLKKTPKFERSLSRTDEKRDPKRAPCKAEGKAPVLLKKIQAEMAPKHSGNIKLSCQFSEIHEDSTVCWTKDSKSIAQVKKSAGDNSSVSLAIAQAGQKDQGLYYCCIKNSYGKVSAEFNLTAEVLKQLSSHTEYNRGCEEIEFSQLIFKEDVFNDSYFGDHLRGQISTEELHFGEGVHRKAFRSTVMQGLMPVFQPGHACVLKVHNAVAHGTRNNDELVQRNYKLAAQECYVQNTARYYAKIYAAEAEPLEGFGEVPEIIPIFLIRRPENNIPYATVEEELIGEFVKYSIRDGKEINFLRRDSEAGQKCCTFQHWVYQKTSGCLLVTDMQGVGMKLTDVGIATLARGYKGFKGNCSMTFIDQFRALHQCNKYCKMLGLKSLQNNTQKPKKTILGKGRVQTNSTPVKVPESETPTEKKT